MDVDEMVPEVSHLVTVRPTQFSTSEKTQFLELAEDRLCVRYTGKGQHQHDVGDLFYLLLHYFFKPHCIRANAPLQNDIDIAYFEIELLQFTPGTKLAIGLVGDSFVLDSLPGSQSMSIGYYSSGECWINGHRRGPHIASFKSGSVVGCGLTFSTGQLFFTLDGVIVRTEEHMPANLVPTVGLHATGQTVRANFGTSPFKFDIEQKRSQLHDAHIAEIDEIPAPSFTRIVYNYLLFHGLRESAEAFAASNPPDLHPLTERDNNLLSTLELRSQIRQWILSGELDKVKHCLIEQFDYLAVVSKALFVIDTQIFIEHIRRKQIPAALQFSRSVFMSWWMEDTIPIIENCCALLAHTSPEQSPYSYLLSRTRLEEVADIVNRSILRWTGLEQQQSPNGAPPAFPGQDEPDLPHLLAHLSKVHNIIRLNQGAGEIFHLDTYAVPPIPDPLTSSASSLRSSAQANTIRSSQTLSSSGRGGIK